MAEIYNEKTNGARDHAKESHFRENFNRRVEIFIYIQEMRNEQDGSATNTKDKEVPTVGIAKGIAFFRDITIGPIITRGRI